jgi:GT2 family glycosyltransferase
LLRTFASFSDAGVVGGKLIFPDGTLQEAGSLVFEDGSAANFGRTDPNVERDEYSFVRQVDYCSGALFATPRKVFEQIGGFDQRYRPGYYEDTDYCFKVRSLGRRVYYQPRAAVVHREGGTAGNDLKSGMKRYQVINASKFFETWKMALKSHGPPPLKVDLSTWQRLLVRSHKLGSNL